MGVEPWSGCLPAERLHRLTSPAYSKLLVVIYDVLKMKELESDAGSVRLAVDADTL